MTDTFDPQHPQSTSDYPIVEIAEEPIALCQLLKIANLVSGGGEAKVVISEGYVLLNGEVEYQKRKKVYENDIIEFNGEVIQIAINTQSKALPDPSMFEHHVYVANDFDAPKGGSFTHENKKQKSKNSSGPMASSSNNKKSKNTKNNQNIKSTKGKLSKEISFEDEAAQSTPSRTRRKPISF